MRVTDTRWIDLGDFGQHQAEVTAHVACFGAHVSSVIVKIKGQEIQLANMIPHDYEQVVLEEMESEFHAGEREAFIDFQIKAQKEAANV